MAILESTVSVNDIVFWTVFNLLFMTPLHLILNPFIFPWNLIFDFSAQRTPWIVSDLIALVSLIDTTIVVALSLLTCTVAPDCIYIVGATQNSPPKSWIVFNSYLNALSVSLTVTLVAVILLAARELLIVTGIENFAEDVLNNTLLPASPNWNVPSVRIVLKPK